MRTALDPAFSLVNTSSFYRGRRTGTCARPFVYRRLGDADHLRHGRLGGYVDTAAAWRRRTQHRYIEFRRAAEEVGIDGDRVDEVFGGETAVWNPVRLRDDIDTVEWCSPDATLPSNVLRLVEEVTWLVETAVDGSLYLDSATPGVGTDRVEVPPFDRLRTLRFDAMARGLGSPGVRDYLSAMGFETPVYQPIGSRAPNGRWLSPADARGFRRTAADLLERDLERLDTSGTRFHRRDLDELTGRDPSPREASTLAHPGPMTA